ncbi:NADPH-dependent FMN reductase [Priestia taiwanensis]|uniref:NADPH-dependent FMN reductase n=1 Tax=Priestia taiwanensis TaxID=1347902 RepID=A0A917EPX8_9BACI|nr:NADPH-dependent FMN reductase [Priestia taiwanensis]MBM7364286.1 azobenzene reductase [Priestia taiwanensis]GGE73213.1 NADPH-dependent FMN reductase [Priestia taiwanensis]
MKLVVINGTPRTFGRTRLAAKWMEKHHNAQLFDLSTAGLPLYNGESEQREVESVQALQKLVAEADGVILCSPEYHSGMSGALKNALDFLGSELTHKPVGLFAVGGGGKGGMNALNNMRIVSRGLYANVIPKQVVVDKNFILEDGELAENAVKLVNDLVTELRMYMEFYHGVVRKQLS